MGAERSGGAANVPPKAEKRMVELSPNEVRLLREALLAFRNKLLSAGKPTEDVNELIIKVMR